MRPQSINLRTSLSPEVQLPVSLTRQQLWRDAHQVVLRGHSIWVMASEDLPLTVCINSACKRFFKLKALCAIAETIQTSPHLEWPTVIQKAHAYGCSAIVYAALVAIQLTAGCTLPGAVLERLTVGSVRKAVIRALCRYRSFTSLAALYDGWHICGRPLGPSVLLLGVTYGWA
jgi:hypothetical protein